MVIGDSNGTLIWSNLYGDKHLDGKHEERLMFVSEKKFHPYPVHKLPNLEGCDGRSPHAWIVPALQNSMYFSNDAL